MSVENMKVINRSLKYEKDSKKFKNEMRLKRQQNFSEIFAVIKAYRIKSSLVPFTSFINRIQIGRSLSKRNSTVSSNPGLWSITYKNTCHY